MVKGTHFYDLNQECSTVIEPEYDEYGNLKSSKKVIDHLQNHIIPLDNAKREYESSIFDYEFFTLTNEDIVRCKEKFDRNYGTFSDGKIMKIDKDEYYFKFTTNIAISVDAGIKKLNEAKGQKLFSLISLYKRSIEQFPTLSLFINGVKIPDELIYIYMGESCTDILIPESYLRKNANTDKYESMEIYVQKHVYLANKYYSVYQKGIANKRISIDLNEAKINKENLDYNKKIIVYCNGLYKLSDTYTVTRNGDILNIDFPDSYLATDAIEVVFDFNIKEVNTIYIEGNNDVLSAKLVRCFFNLKESSINYKTNFLYGSLPKKNCYFYINNKRIPLNRIKQIGRLNYVYENEETPNAPYACTIVYTDKDTIDESKNYIYGEDYYLSNFYGMDNITKILNKLVNGNKLESTDPFVNKYLLNNSLDYMYLMNRNMKMYSKGYFEELRRLTDIYLDYESQTRSLIKKTGNYLIRDFMNLYSKNDIFVEVFKDENIPPMLSYTFSTKKSEETNTTGFYYLLDINGDHIPTNKYEIKENYQYNHINIPTTLLKDGFNRIHIRENKYDTGTNGDIEYKVVYPSEIEERIIPDDNTDYDSIIDELIEEYNDINTSEERKREINILIQTYENAKVASYKYQYTFNKFKTPLDISDYLCLNFTFNESKYYYSDERNSGWIVNRNCKFNRNADGSITLLMKNKPTENIIIYSKRFAFKFHINISKDLETLEDMSIVVGSNDAIGLPIIPNGSFTVFLNGERLYNGIDYVFRHPGNYNLITYTSLCLKRKTKVDDEVDIYFDSVQNVTVGRSNDILSHSGTVWNKYGLIYFGNLSYPYSPKYIDLYVNGKYIYPDQIDILSDKLIRIDPEIANPMFDIFAETSFGVDIEKLKYFFDYDGNKYEDSALEKLLASIFVDYDFSTITNPPENSGANAIYESFDDNVDSWGHIANTRRAEDSDEAMEIAEELVSKRYNLYENAYLLWLKSNGTKTLIDTNKDIDQDIMNYFKFYLEDTILSERQDIVISARTTKTFNDIVFDASKYPIEYSDRVRRMLKFAKGNNLSTKELFEKLRDHLPISNALYPRDFPCAISSKTMISQTNRDLVIGGKPGLIYSNTTSHKTED